MLKLTRKPLRCRCRGQCNILSFFQTNNSYTPRPVLNRYVSIRNDSKIFAVHVYKQPSIKHTITKKKKWKCVNKNVSEFRTKQ
jgi:hypothetical protein